MSTQTQVDEWFYPAAEDDAQADDCGHLPQWTINGRCARCDHSGPTGPYDGALEAVEGRSAGARQRGGGR